MDELAERTRNAGDQYTSWTVYEVAPTAAGTEPEKTYVGYMIDRQFVSLDEIDAERQAEHEDQAVDPDYDRPAFVEMNAEPPHPPRTLADYECVAGEDHYVDNQGRPYDPPAWYVSDYERTERGE